LPLVLQRPPVGTVSNDIRIPHKSNIQGEVN